MRRNTLLLVILFSASICSAQIPTSEHPVAPPVYGPAPGNQEFPRIATNSAGFLAIWTDYRGNGDVYGTRIDVRGRLLDPNGILIARGPAIAAIAAAGQDYLIALARACDLIEVVTFRFDGTVSAPRPVANTSGRCVASIEIRSNGEDFLIAWEPGHAVLVDRRGEVLQPLIIIPSFLSRLDVTSLGETFLVVGFQSASRILTAVPIGRTGNVGRLRELYRVENPTGVAVGSDGSRLLIVTGGDVLRTQIVGFDGTPITQPKIVYSATPSLAPRVAWNGTEFVIAFSRPGGTSGDVLQFMRVNKDGDAITGVTPITRVAQHSVAPNHDVAAAPNLGTFLIWSNEGNVFGGFVPANPAQLLATELAVSASRQTSPQITSTAAGFVVVWNEFSEERGFRLRAAALNEQLTQTSDVIEIAPADFAPVPRVAFDGTRVIITWKTGGVLYARRFTPQLVPIDSQPVAIAAGVTEHSLAVSDSEALIVFIRVGPNSNSYFDVYGALLETGQSVMSIRSFTIAELPNEDHAPAAAWNGSEFLVVWAHALTEPLSQLIHPSGELRPTRISRAGSVLEPAPRVIQQIDGRVTGAAVASNGSDAYVAWTSAIPGISVGVYGMTLALDGATPQSDPVLLSPPGVRVTSLSLLGAGNSYVVAWLAGETPHYTIQYRTVAANRLSPIVSSPSMEATTAGATIAIRGMTVVAAYERLAYGEPYGGVERVFVRVMPPPPRQRAASPR